MAELTLINTKVGQAKAYYLELLEELRQDLLNGKSSSDCSCDEKLACLQMTITSLEFDLKDGINNEATTTVYSLLLTLLGGYSGSYDIDLSVSAGGGTIILNGGAGPTGLSAYELAVKNGFIGTEAQWLESLKVAGSTGKSAYTLAVEQGFEGTEAEWLESLKANDRTWVTGELAPIRTDITNIKNENTTQNTSITNLNSFKDNIGIIKDIVVQTTASGKCKDFLQITPSNNYCHVTISVVNSASTVKTFEFVSGYDALSTDWSILTPEIVYNDRNLDFNIEIRKVSGFGPLDFGIVIRYRNTSPNASKATVSVDYALEVPSVGTNFDKFTLLTTPEYDFSGVTSLTGRKLTLTPDGLNYVDTNNKKFLKEGDILFEAASEFGDEFGDEFGTGGSLATQTYVNDKDALLQGQINNLGTTYQAIAAKNVANGYAGIGSDGLIPSIFLPALPGRNTFTVASEAAMLALAAAKGDFAIRTDISATYVLGDTPATTLANWKLLPNPSGGVTSFNTLTGAVTVNSTNIPEGTNLYFTNARVKAYGDLLYATIVHTHAFADLTSKPTTLAGYGILDAEPSFSKNTAFNKNFGQVSGTVVQGNDQRILDGLTAFGWDNHANQRYFKYETASAFGVDANTLAGGRSQFTYALNAPFSGPITHFDANGYGLFFNAGYLNSGSQIAFRTRNGDNNTFNPWYTLLHSSNFNTYSPTLTGTGASGTWGINITGGAASATTATGWGDAGNQYNGAEVTQVNSFLMGYSLGAKWQPIGQAAIRTFLGLGSNAYSSVGFLPLAGGTLTGALSGTSASFSNRVLATGIGNDYNTGAFEAVGNGSANTIFPTIGFHQPGLYGSSIQLRGVNDFRFYQQGSLAFAKISAGDGYFSGYVTAAGGAGTSDARYKNIKNFDFDLTQLDNINYYQFEWNKKMSVDDKGRQHWGYLAQEIQAINPDLIMGTEEKLALNKEELLILEVMRLKQRISALEGLAV